MTDFQKSLAGLRLTTAEILYRMPDHQDILQTYIWQDYDREPEFPALNRFLEFWQRELDGPLFSVRIAHHRVISPAEVRFVEYLDRLH